MQLTVIEHAGQPVGRDDRTVVVFRPPGGTIGRDHDNHLVLQDDTRQISRLQALLQVAEDACSLKNLSSVSPIEINRTPIGYAQASRLNVGDIVRIGPYLLRAELDSAADPRMIVDGATPHTGAKSMRNKLRDVLHAHFGSKDAADVESTAQPPLQVATPDQRRPSAAPTHDLQQLSTDPLDLFAPTSRDGVDALSGPATPGPDRTLQLEQPPQRPQAVPPITQADHAPDWASHVRIPQAVPAPSAPRVSDHATDATAPRAAPDPAQPVIPDTLWRAFFEGAGLDASAQPPQWSEEQLFIAGQLLALFANGTVELLSSRSILKREVKADMTMLLDRENNPLKLLPDGSAVLRQMFGLPFPGFMSPQNAVSDAFQDLHAHQIGMVAGMRAALMDLLARFAPPRLRERDNPPRWYELGVPALYKARLWDRYATIHRETVFAIEDDFASVFGKAFLTAYDAEVERYRGRTRG
ncbi:type VI secretion system-associated FHA domain protein TagH (plasmid) [Ralstonia sp. R-29]|uniref:type VI secretion system-associated FHA domain protein TagH n=1 Tax=Ralstonia sp. R-29 TaxID=3404059 RepID=UPI003CEEE07F